MNAKTSSPWGRVVFWGVVALVVVTALIWRGMRPESNVASVTNDEAVGKQLSALDLQPLTGDGAAVSPETIQGKVVLMNYWDTTCGICMHELPHIVELWDRYRSKPDVQFLSVSASGEAMENLSTLRETTENLLKSKGISMPMYADPSGATQAGLAALLGMSEISYPATVIVDRRGIIRAVWRGYAVGDERIMEQMLSKLLAEQ
ncbi:MAG: TlpA family protein disulfide reductase [Pirellulales bacterium]|nr:TlpA family protein disulfide reductase [Pirellulales bacterium]